MESLAASALHAARVGAHPLRRRVVHWMAAADARRRDGDVAPDRDALTDVLRIGVELAAAAAEARDAAAPSAPSACAEIRARELSLHPCTVDGPRPVVATVRAATATGEPLLYWAVREDAHADVGDLL